ncbi:hypothetical protein BDR26DRAFT_932338 [Obelidium mucronatum]|nr:hypothetical protein BDR26DRAFT_932338 [Obelidium mucronatum]
MTDIEGIATDDPRLLEAIRALKANDAERTAETARGKAAQSAKDAANEFAGKLAEFRDQLQAKRGDRIRKLIATGDTTEIDKEIKNLEAIVADIEELTKAPTSATGTATKPTPTEKARPVPRQITDAAKNRSFTTERTYPLIPYLIEMRELLDEARPNELETWTRACAGPDWAAINKPELTQNLTPDNFCKAMIDLYFVGVQGRGRLLAANNFNMQPGQHIAAYNTRYMWFLQWTGAIDDAPSYLSRLPTPLRAALSYCITKSGPETRAEAELVAAAIHYTPEPTPRTSNKRERRYADQEEEEQQERTPTRTPQRAATGKRPTCTKCKTLAESHPNLNINFTHEEANCDGRNQKRIQALVSKAMRASPSTKRQKVIQKKLDTTEETEEEAVTIKTTDVTPLEEEDNEFNYNDDDDEYDY